jgi:hypothetical protein
MPPHRCLITAFRVYQDCPVSQLRGRIDWFYALNNSGDAIGQHLGVIFCQFSLTCGSFHMRNISDPDVGKPLPHATQ